MIKFPGLCVIALMSAMPILAEAQADAALQERQQAARVAEENAARAKAEADAAVRKEAEAKAAHDKAMQDKAAAIKADADKKAAAEKLDAEQKAVVQAKVAARRVGFNAKAQRDAQRNHVKNVADGGSFKMKELVNFGINNGRLAVDFVGKSIPPNQQRRVRIEGSNATWLINHAAHPNMSYFNLNYYDFDAPEDEFWMITVSVNVQPQLNMVTVYAQGGDACDVMRLYYTQQNNNVTMNLTGWENNRQKQILTANAPDIMRLRNEHPEEFRRYLIPILRKVTCQPILRPGAGDVYRVFPQIAADPAVTSKLESILPGLIAPAAQNRRKAAEQLNALGAPGVLAALRLDPATLVPEQVCRLSDMVALNSRIVIDDPADVGRDYNFLLDCLEDEDLAVRKAAKDALEKLIGKAVLIDLAAAPAKRSAAVDALRSRLNKELKKDEAPKKEPENQPAQPQAVPFNGRVRLNVQQ